MSECTPAQREKVRGRCCVACDQPATDPMHLIDKSMTTIGQDDPRAVVPGCRACHDAYDGNTQPRLNLLPHLEPHWREELAFAVERVGLVTTLRRVTNDRGAA